MKKGDIVIRKKLEDYQKDYATKPNKQILFTIILYKVELGDELNENENEIYKNFCKTF